MCSINHDLKAIYIHIPKTGGLFIEKILEKFYNFKTYYFTSEYHNNYVYDKDDYFGLLGMINIRNKGIYRYYNDSNNFNILSNMDINKWKEYKKFTFIRNPYDRCISAYNFLKLFKKNISFHDTLINNNLLNNYEYSHLIISQYDHLVDNENNIKIDYIGNFDNLNEELIKILIKLNIKKLTHSYYIKNNLKINETTYFKKYDLLNNEIILLINNIFHKDFENFNYQKYENLDSFMLNKEKESLNISNKINLYNYNFKKRYNLIKILIDNENYNEKYNENENFIKKDYDNIKKYFI